MKQSIVYNSNDDDDDDDDDRIELGGKKWVPFVFVLLGIGLLLPWNAFISAKGYFESRLETHDNFMLWFGFLYNGFGTFSLAIILSNKILCASTTTTTSTTTSSTSSTNDDSRYEMKRVVFPLCVFFGVFVVTSMMVLMTWIRPIVFLHLTLVSLAVCGSASAVAGAGIIFVTSFFPPQEAVNPFVAGQSAGGVILSAINTITTAASPPPTYHCHNHHYNNTTTSSQQLQQLLQIQVEVEVEEPYHVDFAAFTYFGICSLILGFCILSYILLERLPITHYYRSKAKQQSHSTDTPFNPSSHHHHIQDEEHSNDLSELLLPSPSSQQQQQQLLSHNHQITTTDNNNNNNNNNVIMETWNFVYYPALAIFLSFLVTLTLFPSWITKVQSIHMMCQHQQGTTTTNHNRINNDLFVPITILIFNLGDLLGRIMAKTVSIDNSKKFSFHLFLMAMARFIFFPLFLLCNVPGKSISILIASDTYFYILLLTFAISNGLLVTLTFMHAPQLLPSNNHHHHNHDEMQEVASTILTFAVSIGLLSGSTLSFLFNYIGTGTFI